MKKLLLLVVSLTLATSIYAQQFGVKAGFNTVSLKASYEEESNSKSANGFYVGVLGVFDSFDVIEIQPEFHFVYLTKDSDNTSFLFLPVMVGYKVADNLLLQAGPNFSYQLEETMDDFTNFGIDIGLGAKFDIQDRLFADARYLINVNNHYTGDHDGLTLHFNTFQIGVGYMF